MSITRNDPNYDWPQQGTTQTMTDHNKERPTMNERYNQFKTYTNRMTECVARNSFINSHINTFYRYILYLLVNQWNTLTNIPTQVPLCHPVTYWTPSGCFWFVLRRACRTFVITSNMNVFDLPRASIAVNWSRAALLTPYDTSPVNCKSIHKFSLKHGQ
mgnify:FL=1